LDYVPANKGIMTMAYNKEKNDLGVRFARRIIPCII
jgi:hypothetical protein